jgi:hypothetical protein
MPWAWPLVSVKTKLPCLPARQRKLQRICHAPETLKLTILGRSPPFPTNLWIVLPARPVLSEPVPWLVSDPMPGSTPLLTADNGSLISPSPSATTAATMPTAVPTAAALPPITRITRSARRSLDRGEPCAARGRMVRTCASNRPLMRGRRCRECRTRLSDHRR